MKTIGFPISHKENELRRAVLAKDLNIVKHADNLYFEKGYGNALGIKDEEYVKFGAHIVNRTDVLSKDVICDPKIGDADYLDQLKDQIIFGWIHAVQNRDIADKMIEGRLSGYAWEDMFDDGRHCFWRNNEIAGEAAVFHAFMCHGVFPYGKKIAVLGRGNTARGAIKMLSHLGADVITYDRRTEHLFRREIGNYDVIVNAILWDTNRKDHIIYKEDLVRMKFDSMIIDISCDRNGGIETSVPTMIETPTYIVNGVRHYVVDHTPSLFWKTTSESLSQQVVKYLDIFVEDKMIENEILKNAHIFEFGKILDQKIIEFQNRL